MAKQTINEGETGLVVRTKLNDMFTELYQRPCDVAFHSDASVPVTLTNQPNSEQDFPLGNIRTRKWFDATLFTQVRLSVRVAGGSTSINTPRLYLQYSTDESSWTTVGSGTGTEIISLASIATVKTTWITLPAGAKADVVWRIANNGGDGAADPIINNIYATFR